MAAFSIENDPITMRFQGKSMGNIACVLAELFASNAPQSSGGVITPPAPKKSVEWGSEDTILSFC